MKTYSDERIEEIDLALCRLHSMGTVVAQLSIMECQEPDLTAMADVGRIITEVAMDTLNKVQDGQELSESVVAQLE